MAQFARKQDNRGALGTLLIVALCATAFVGCERGRTADSTNPSAVTNPAERSASATSAPSRASDATAPEPLLSEVIQLTRGFQRAGEAYFSPDGRWIIFQAAARGRQHYDMYVARVERQGEAIVGLRKPVRISPENSWNSCGYFSPDGRTLIFASTGQKGVPDEPAGGYQRQGGNYRWQFPAGAEVFRADGWEDAVRKSAEAASGGTPAAVDLARKAITRNDAYDAECAFSPDGNWIVFGSNRDGDAELYAMRPDGTDVVRLTNAKGYDGGPFFSPDGRRITYRSDRQGNDLLQVYVADVAFDGGGRITGIANERQLTDDANVNWGPYWHPGGRHLAYATSAHGHHNYEVYWMRDDGSGKARVTSRPGFDGLPVFSAGGEYLLWSSKRTADNTTQVFVARFKPPAD